MAMKTIVALPGQGIGPEVVDATCELLMGKGLPLKALTPPPGKPLTTSSGSMGKLPTLPGSGEGSMARSPRRTQKWSVRWYRIPPSEEAGHGRDDPNPIRPRSRAPGARQAAPARRRAGHIPLPGGRRLRRQARQGLEDLRRQRARVHRLR